MTFRKVYDDSLIVGSVVKDHNQSFFIRFKRNQRVDFKNNNNIYFLASGSVSFYRYEDNVITISKHAPFMLGIAQMRSELKTHYVRCNSECEMYGIPIEDANNIFSSYNLWGNVFNILTEQIHEYFSREHMVFQKNVNTIVKQHLRYIWDMGEESRSKISIYKFILMRNHISRSSIHKVVKTMIDSGCIRVDNGKLLYYNPECT